MLGNRRIFHGIAYIGFCIVFLFALKTFGEAIPDHIYVAEGEELSGAFDVPVTVVVKDEGYEAAGVVSAGKAGTTYTVTCRLFGVFPVKDVEVTLVEKETVLAGGTPIGIYVEMEGVLVIAEGDVTLSDGTSVCPAENILKAGDYITGVNGETVSGKENLQELVQKYGGGKETLTVRRSGEEITVGITPALGADQSYKLGVWVRDDLAGIGTLTYYTEDGKFGALGHAVSDGDVGEMIDVEEGWIYTSQIIGVKKGGKGSPGELSGLIDYTGDNCLGTIEQNTGIGIYGTLNGNVAGLSVADAYEIRYKQDIELGEAYIISGLSGEKKEYGIEIETLDYSGKEDNKGILFQVTDGELLELTGGIVQGMSGSPIVQDGAIIGAVTHVFVSDPSMGYGIFIETMLNHG